MANTSKIVSVHQPCPLCPSSDAYCTYDDGHGYCFSCQGYTFPEGKEFDLSSSTYEYLPWRGVNKETMQFYDIRTKVDANGEPFEIGYPWPCGTVQVRSLLEKKFRWEPAGAVKPGLFGRDKFAAGSARAITVTEGALDAATMFQSLGGYPSVGCQSSSSAYRDCLADREYLNQFERIYLALDNDAPGRAAASEVARLFEYDKVYFVKFNERKDANEFAQKSELEELKKVWWNSKKFCPEEIRSSLSDFRELLSEEPEVGFPYPFRGLNEKTLGMRRGETVLVTAMEGVGKTEVMHAIEYKLLMETNENVGAIFLEEPPKRHLEALAGILLKRPVHLPESGVGRDDVARAVEQICKKDGRLHLLCRFGNTDPRELSDNIRFLFTSCSCDTVLLDHISLGVGEGSGTDERQTFDKFAFQLESMVKELHKRLIVVSHVNDDGKTRGSRMISKSFDVRIDVFRDVAKGDPISRFVVSKNRNVGPTGPAGLALFNLETRQWTEIDDDAPKPDEGRVRGAAISRETHFPGVVAN